MTKTIEVKNLKKFVEVMKRIKKGTHISIYYQYRKCRLEKKPTLSGTFEKFKIDRMFREIVSVGVKFREGGDWLIPANEFDYLEKLVIKID